jgi:hypothetical protein
MRIPSGVTDQYIYFVAVDATDLKTRETGLSSFTVYRSRNGGAAAAYTTPTVNETDTTNMPGVYELLLDEDMTIDSGDDSQEVVLHITHAGMAPVTRTFELYRSKITAGNTLDVTTTGEAGLDFNNVAIPDGPVPALGIVEGGTAQSATSTTLVGRAASSVADDAFNGCVLLAFGSTQGYWQTATISDTTLSTDTFTHGGWSAGVTPSGTITYRIFGTPSGSTALDAAGIRSALGMASANLDTQLSTIDTVVDAILVDTGTTLDGRLPAALVSGRMDCSVGAMAANTITAAAAASDFGTEVATAVLAAAAADPIDANIEQINTVAVVGDGSGTPFTV